jgi:ribonuclease P protein component
MSTVFVWKKRCRIRKNDDFKTIFKHGHKIGHKWIRIFFLSGKEPNPAFGITLTKKIRGSILRNYYKRVIREILRKNQHRVQPGWRIVINIFSCPEFGLTYQTIQEEILGLLKHGKVLLPDK